MLTLTNIIKRYATPAGEALTVLDVPDFRVLTGTQLALHGPSGSGKTTLLHIIAGVLLPDSGTVSLDGAALSAMSEAKRDFLRATQIGYLFQSFNLLQGFSVRDNLLLAQMFGGQRNADRIDSLLERVGLLDRADYQPHQLSFGQQQRVALVRALINHPKLVLADEPTGSLDRENADAVLALIREVCAEEHAALLLVSHEPEIINQFEHQVSLAEINRAMRPAAPQDNEVSA